MKVTITIEDKRTPEYTCSPPGDSGLWHSSEISRAVREAILADDHHVGRDHIVRIWNAPFTRTLVIRMEEEGVDSWDWVRYEAQLVPTRPETAHPFPLRCRWDGEKFREGYSFDAEAFETEAEARRILDLHASDVVGFTPCAVEV